MEKFNFYTVDDLEFVGSAVAEDWMQASRLVSAATGVENILPQNWKKLSACEPLSIPCVQSV